MTMSEQSASSPLFFKVTHQRCQNKIRKIFIALLNVDKELSAGKVTMVIFYLLTVFRS